MSLNCFFFFYYNVRKMKSIMEETKTVQNFTILLYSRTYETLYLQIFHSQNKNLLSKHIIKTSEHVSIDLGMPLNEVQMMVKKSQESMQIMSEFKFCFDDFSSNSRVQQMQHYVKLKKNFPQYSLLFQIFYQLKSTINSTTNLAILEEKQAERLLIQEKKKEKLMQLQDITKSNLILLGFKVINTLFRKKPKHRTVFSDQGSMEKKGFSRNMKKNKTIPYMFNNMNNQTKTPSYSKYSKSVIGKCSQQGSSRNCSKKSTIIEHSRDILDSKNESNEQLIKERPAFLRNEKKNLTMRVQKSAFMKQRSQRKKITFIDQMSFDDNNEENGKLKKSKLFSINQNSQKNIQHSQIQKKKNFLVNKKNNSSQKQDPKVYQDENNSQNQDSFSEKPENENYCNPKNETKKDVILENLRDLCKQKKNQKILIRKFRSSKTKLNHTMTKSLQISQKNHEKLVKTCPSALKKSSAFENSPYITNRLHRSRDKFYDALFEKTIKTLQRQSQILNYVNNHCSVSNFRIRTECRWSQQSNQLCEDLKKTNLTTETNQTNSNLKVSKIKKVKVQSIGPSKFKVYVDNKNKKVLRS